MSDQIVLAFIGGCIGYAIVNFAYAIFIYFHDIRNK